jgi:cytosine/adenosine deaminase-related metal-dependent hydrolase
MINPFLRFVEAGAEAYWSAADPTPYERPHAEFFLTATGLLHRAGVPLLVGTDAGGFGLIPGRSLVEELALLVEAGLTPLEALEAATRVNAEVLGFTGAGQIVPGAKANLVLLAANPLEDFAVLEAPVAVAIRGEWLDAQALGALRDAAAETSFLRSAWRALEMLPSP